MGSAARRRIRSSRVVSWPNWVINCSVDAVADDVDAMLALLGGSLSVC